LSQLIRDSKLTWKACLPESPWSNSWSKINKNNYRAICENVKCSTNALTLVNLNMNLERLDPACLQDGRSDWLLPSCQCSDLSKSLSHLAPLSTQPLLHGLL
jgi:hypothetical protein